MPDYRHSITLRAGAEKVFNFLSKPENLPRYVDQMTKAEPAGRDTVEVTAQLQDGTVTGEAWFTVDRIAHRIHWGAEGSHDYKGTLEVVPDQDRTNLELTIHTEHTADDQITESMKSTLERLRGLLEPA